MKQALRITNTILAYGLWMENTALLKCYSTSVLWLEKHLELLLYLETYPIKYMYLNFQEWLAQRL
jgi:hypothetical protein